MLKACSTCNDLKHIREFNKQAANKDGFQYICRSCNKENIKKWNDKNPGYQRRQKLEKMYNISVHEYNDLFEKQGGCCAICRRHQSDYKRSLAVDHDHLTGNIRGLLCHPCNFSLGNMRDDPELLETAAAYLRRSKLTLVEKE